MATIQLDEALIKSVVSEAILTSLSEEQRNILIKSALQFLLTPAESYGGGRRLVSPIQEAFNSGLHGVATRVAADMMANDSTITASIQTLVQEALKLLMTTNRQVTVKKLADAIAEGMAYRENR